MIWQDSENITTLVEYLQKDPGFLTPGIFKDKQNTLKTHTNEISLDIGLGLVPWLYTMSVSLLSK